MPSDASACVTAVCTALPDCCQVGWDEACVQQVETACHRSCSQVGYMADNEGFHGRRVGAAALDFVAFDEVIANEPYTEHRLNEIAVADFDGDGRPDLAASSPHGWYVVHNDSTRATVQLRVVASHLVPSGDNGTDDNIGGSHIAWADWDHDGDLDLAVTYLRDGLYLIRHDPGAEPPFVQLPTPLLPTGTNAFDWGDIDGDHDIDLVTAHQRTGTIHLNDGSGRFTARAWGGNAEYGIRLCDVMGSGLPEVVTATWDGPLHVYENTGFPLDRFAQSLAANQGEHYGEIDCADLDGDGDLDIAAGGSSSQEVVRLFRNLDRASFETTPIRPIATQYPLDAMDMGDVNGDRRIDVVLSYGGDLVWLENQTSAGGDLQLQVHPGVPNLAELALDLGPEASQ
jgi:hypothetical protein